MPTTDRLPGTRPRHGALAPVARILPAAMLVGCTALPDSGTAPTPTDADWTFRLAPATAAWVLAATCRQELVEADPHRTHRDPPVIRVGESFRILYRRDHGSVYRTASNGRLSAPVCPKQWHVQFATTPERGIRAPFAADQVSIHIDPGLAELANHCRVQLELRGSAAARGLFRRARSNLAAAAAAEHANLELCSLAPHRALQHIDTGLAAIPMADTPVRRRLVALLYVQRAQARKAIGDLVGAHQAAARATGVDPQLKVAQAELQLARARLTMRAGRRSNSGESGRMDAGDVQAAILAARTTLTRQPSATEPRTELAKLYRTRGQLRAALGEELHVLATAPDTETVLRIAALYSKLGTPASGLRVLAGYPQAWQGKDAPRVRRVVRALATHLPPGLAWRILRPLGRELADRVVGPMPDPSCAQAYRGCPKPPLPAPRNNSRTLRGGPGLYATPPR